MSRTGLAIAMLLAVASSDAAAATKPHIEPIERTPYSRDDDAPPTPVGFIIGTGGLVVLLTGVSLGIRRRGRREERARWLAAHPGAHEVEGIDPWLARDSVERARGLARELDDAGRLDRYARLRMDFVTQLDPPAPGEDRLVVHVEGAVRDPDVAVRWVPLRRILGRLRRPPRARRFAEFWTVARRGDEWSLVGMERDRTAPRSKAARASAPWAPEAVSAKG